MANCSVTNWVAEKIDSQNDVKVVDRTTEDFLLIRHNDGRAFPIAVLGVDGVIQPGHVQPVLSHATKPEFVMNVPSKALWSGSAISLIHATPAAFGTLGDLLKASRSDDVPAYRNKTYGFFEQAISQHSNVSGITRIYDAVFEAQRRKGNSLTIALVEAYNMSAEDVRNARRRFGPFDIAVKTTSYGSITDAARMAADSMGVEAMMFKDLMRRLVR
jgi:hypothetical protein